MPNKNKPRKKKMSRLRGEEKEGMEILSVGNIKIYEKKRHLRQ
jgi:hypothetical protein